MLTPPTPTDNDPPTPTLASVGTLHLDPPTSSDLHIEPCTPSTSLRPITVSDTVSFCSGRQYHHYRAGRYLLPNDRPEQNREELKHEMLLGLTEGAHFLAPLPRGAVRQVLDLGTGTGTWAIEVGEAYDARVLGWDLSLIQRGWDLDHVRFDVADIEEDWDFPLDGWMAPHGFDLIHARHVLPFIKNGEALARRAWKHLRPGGWVELQDLEHVVRCDDATMEDDYPVKVFFQEITNAWGNAMGADLSIAPRLGGILERTGFVNITVKKYKIPIGAWAGKKANQLGIMFKWVIQLVIEALVSAIATVEGWSEEKRDRFMVMCDEALQSEEVHAYMDCYFVYGQKPAK